MFGMAAKDSRFCWSGLLALALTACAGSSSHPVNPVAQNLPPANPTPSKIGQQPVASSTPLPEPGPGPGPLPGGPSLGHSPAPSPTPNVSSKRPRFSHVFIVVLENQNITSARSAPFLKWLAKTGGLLTNYHANGHPSQPNYITMIAGSRLGVTNDEIHHINQTNVVDLLEAKHLTWKAYAEDLPGPCRQRDKGLFAQRHVPFMSFNNIMKDPRRCANIVDAKQLNADIARGALPNFAMYTPNLHNDGHNTNLRFADAWLSAKFGPILQDRRFTSGTLFIVTFDESVDQDPANHIYTVLYNPEHVKMGSVDQKKFDHASLLRLIEDNFNLGTLGRGDASAAPVTDIFK